MNLTATRVADIKPGMIVPCQTFNGTERVCTVTRVDAARAACPGLDSKLYEGSRINHSCGEEWTLPNFYTEYVADLNFS